MEQSIQELVRPDLGQKEPTRKSWKGRFWFCVWVVIGWVGSGLGNGLADTASTALEKGPRFTVGSYNLENYLDVPKGTRRVKTEASKAQVRKTLIKLNADILALQEVGSYEAFQELRESLRREGLDYPHSEFVRGWDTNIFLGVLSRYEIVARRPHTNTSFVLNGRRLHVSRGFAEVDVRLNPSYQITLLSAHLKSRRSSYEANEADWREQEALRLREVVDARLAANPRVNLVVVGDLNDTPDSKPIRSLVGRGKMSLVDGRPAERNGDDYQATEGRVPTRRVGWTHYYAKEDSYSRIDYILMSRGMAAEWERAGTYVLAIPNWGLASDHRPVVAEFVARER